MRKVNQMLINEHVKGVYADMNLCMDVLGTTKPKRLNSCQAEYFRTDGYIVLRSYNTIIACIAEDEGTCYDFLRYVYGYTATSAKHISKFCQQFNAMHKVTYYPV